MAADSFRDERKAQFVNRKPITILLYKKTSTVSILTAVSGETMLVLYQIRDEPKYCNPLFINDLKTKSRNDYIVSK